MTAGQRLIERALEHSPEWSNRSIQYWNRHCYLQCRAGFAIREECSSMASVNVYQVMGIEELTPLNGKTEHVGRTWEELLKAIPANHQALTSLEANPDIYHDLAIKQPILNFFTQDGVNYFTDSESLPWVVIARYLFEEKGQQTHLHGVSINHHQINEPLYYLYERLLHELTTMSNYAMVYPRRRYLYREDAAGWGCDHYQATILWKEKGQQIELDEATAEDRLRWLQNRRSSCWSRCFNRKPTTQILFE